MPFILAKALPKHTRPKAKACCWEGEHSVNRDLQMKMQARWLQTAPFAWTLREEYGDTKEKRNRNGKKRINEGLIYDQEGERRIFLLIYFIDLLYWFILLIYFIDLFYWFTLLIYFIDYLFLLLYLFFICILITSSICFDKWVIMGYSKCTLHSYYNEKYENCISENKMLLK